MVRHSEPTSTGCSQWATSLLYSLCIIFWVITMCYEMSYLYIELLTQLSYLTYVGFLNTVQVPPKVKLFIWKACKNIVPTQTKLFDKGLSSSFSCQWCLEEPEMCSHICGAVSLLRMFGKVPQS